MIDSIDIVTSFAHFENVDTKPIEKALSNHINNEKVRQIHVLTESKPEVLNEHFKHIFDNKVQVIECEKRPTFSDLITHSNGLIENKLVPHVAVINGDVSFENSTAIERVCKAFKQAKLPINSIFALSRYENINGSLKMCLKLDNGLPNYLSADAWIFNKPCLVNYDLFYHMGQMNCDLMLASDLIASGYTLLNPCLDVKIVHHENELKSDSFYEAENSKQNTIDAQYKFIASRVNPDFTLPALPWLSIDWFDYHYIPAHYKFNNVPTIWLSLQGNIYTENYLNLVQAMEVIASAKGYQFNIVYEGDITPKIVNYFSDVIRLTNNIYFHSIDSAAQFLVDSLNGKVAWSDSCVVVSDPSRITENILAENKEIIICINDDSHGFNFCLSEQLGVDVNWYLQEKYKAPSSLSFYNCYQQRKCSLVTSMFKTDEFIKTFFENCLELEGYEEIDHFLLVSNPTEVEQKELFKLLHQNKNACVIWNRADPGLYECWNIGIRNAYTQYVSNANVDDLRAASHVSTLVSRLSSSHTAQFGCTALYPFYEFSGDLKAHTVGAPWYSDHCESISFKSLGFVSKNDAGETALTPHNIPHCMPVWEKSLHDKYGFFDEETYGTFADWAFWLKVTKNGEKGLVLPEGLGYYYVNLESHNRRGDKLEAFHKRVESEFLPHFMFSEQEKTVPIQSNVTKKLNIWGADLQYGNHRNSFNKLAEALLPLESDTDGVLLLPFIERYFVWGDEVGEAGSTNPSPITTPWVGIIHVPFYSPSWFHSNVYPETIFATELWKQSLPYCKGIITLSEDLKADVQHHLKDLSVYATKHPTDFDNLIPFSFEQFSNKPTIVQIGDWLRKLQAIHQLNANGYRKVMLKKEYTDDYLANEIRVFGDHIDPKVDVRTMVSNEEYDLLLSSSVVLCWLYATAANNLVLECIARKTPIIINPLPSVVEYLGDEYPLYINQIEDAEALLSDLDTIKKAHEYLKHRDFKAELSYDAFYQKFRDSDFYESL